MLRGWDLSVLGHPAFREYFVILSLGNTVQQVRINRSLQGGASKCLSVEYREMAHMNLIVTLGSTMVSFQMTVGGGRLPLSPNFPLGLW